MVDDQGKLVGIITREEALKLSREKSLDLVEIAPSANPPVAKIIDFQKFRYEENKKEQAARKHAKDVEVKELWLSPRIAEHDLNTRLRRAEEFLKDGHKIILRVKFRGREMAHMNLGYALLNKIIQSMGDKASVERDIKTEGRSLTVMLGKNKIS